MQGGKLPAQSALAKSFWSRDKDHPVPPTLNDPHP
jgi:hypothetical protein